MGPEEYLDLIDRCLNTCQFLDTPPHYQSQAEILPEGRGIVWKDVLRLKHGHILRVQDRVLFDREGKMTYRNFFYNLSDSENNLIFRFDTHGEEQGADEACHVHDGDDRTVDFGDCKGMDFGYLMHCIKNHFVGKAQEWAQS
jgi:hypothetical protein